MNHEQVGTLLKQSAAQLRSVTAERDEALESLAEYEKRARAEKVATDMIERELLPSSDREEKVAELMERDDLAVVEEALNLSAPDQLAKVASVGEESRGDGMSELERFILSEAPVSS